ncbi:MAG: hypothetical protein H0V82_01200 [Candidatus Protochlamydia sp.]|nr:hypothetical protein [Candidatus Protochlamydia sp.]
MGKHALSLNFDELSSHLEVNSNEEVEIRGFLYETPSGEVILAASPQLKSCCIGSPDKISRQIVLKGKWESVPLKRAVTVHGRLAAEPKYNEGHELVQLYVLDRPLIMQSTSFPFWSVICIAAFFLIIALIKKATLKPLS